MKKALFYGAALVGGYILVANAKGSASVISSATTGASGLVKTFQGR